MTAGAESISVKGSLGTLVRPVSPLVTVKNEDGKLMFAPANDSPEADAMSGTMRALVNNMVGGVTKGFEKQLNLVGVGYRATRRAPSSTCRSASRIRSPRTCRPASRSSCPSQTEIVITGFDRQAVGQVAAEVRALRPPEPYKGKGIRYADEKVTIKETKKK